MLDAIAAMLLDTYEVRRNASGELVVTSHRDARVVVIAGYRRDDVHAVVLLGFLCAESAAAPTQLLSLAMHIGSGGIGLASGIYWLRHTIPAHAVSPARVLEAVDHVSRLAMDISSAIAASNTASPVANPFVE